MMICNFVFFLTLILLGVSDTTNGSELHCVLQLKVPRNTVVKAPVMKLLKINCTVTQPHGCHWRPSISWCKICGDDCRALNYSNYITTDWKETTQDRGMAFLIFHNISVEDAGLYRCRGGEFTVSHVINVTVTADVREKVSLNQTNTTLGDQNPSSNDLQWLLPYVYICSATAALMVIVILCYVVGCQGRKKHTAKNQHIETENLSDLLLPPHFYVNSDLLTTVVYHIKENIPAACQTSRAVEEKTIPLYEMID